jgi:hypothetical protein
VASVSTVKHITGEYQSNPIADDSEDEKIMNGALSKAERKTKSEKAKLRHRTTPYSKDRYLSFSRIYLTLI